MNILAIPFVATAIALVISWAMFAVLCSLLNETIAQIKAERGRFMRNYFFSQLQDFPNGVNWASMLYLHGTIDLLSREPGKPTNDISPRLFAETLIDVVGKAFIVQTRLDSIPKDRLLNTFKSPALFNFKAATQVLNPSDVVTFFTQAIQSAELKATKEGDGKVDEAQAYTYLVENIETWFCGFMDRLKLWYKKKTRGRLFILGLLLGTLINVDSVELYSFYSASPAARIAVWKFYEQNEPQLARLADSLTTEVNLADSLANQLKRAESLSTKQNMADSLTTKQKTDTLAIRLSKTKTTVANLKVLLSADSLVKATQIPIGLEYNIFNKIFKKKAVPKPAETDKDKKKPDFPSENRNDETPSKGYIIFLKLVGILITGFAASFGAPFWFDLLKKATKI